MNPKIYKNILKACLKARLRQVDQHKLKWILKKCKFLTKIYSPEFLRLIIFRIFSINYPHTMRLIE